MYFIILPTQLFDKRYLRKDYVYVLWEHPQYFTKYNYNKKKLVLHRASMLYYRDYLKKNNYKTKYVPFYKKWNIKKYVIFDPIDKIKLDGDYEILESPNFLLTKGMCEEYREKTIKFFFNAFYMWSKKKLNIMPNIKSQDKYNRKRLKKGVKLPVLPSNSADKEYIKKGMIYVNKHFPNNYGNVDNFIYPVTHKTARKWLTHFIKHKLNNFGSAQDFVSKDNSVLFHSLLSSSINIGLLNPMEIIKKVIKLEKIKLNNLEGYVRQLFWREYQRYCYIYYNFNNKNYFGNKKKLSKKWYTGNTGCLPVDNCIKNGFNTGYLHHIERLMVMGNYMNLNYIKPKDGFRWFMEFSCDSYEWVMHQNVYDMVFFVSGGATMRRPYISSSNYILKMSDYKRDKWSDEWDKKYHAFIRKNKDKLYKFRYYIKIEK